MMLFMLAVSVVLLGMLLMVAAFKPVRPALSSYELRRRQAAGDKAAAEALRREELLIVAETLRRPVTAILFVALTLVLLAALGWQWGAVATVFVALFYARIAGIPLVRKLAKKQYRRREEAMLGFIDRHKKKLTILAGKTQPEPRGMTPGSREEFFHIVDESKTILSPNERKLMTRALGFSERRVTDVMTEREHIVTIEHTELIGPLVLNDLHATGHSCFPVVVKDLDHIVGMLDIRMLLTLEAKRSLTAAKAMTGQAFYVRGDQALDHALAAFVRSRHHLLVVISEEGETLGLLSLKDVLEELFGRKLADEFASDDDLRLVAERRL